MAVRTGAEVGYTHATVDSGIMQPKRAPYQCGGYELK